MSNLVYEAEKNKIHTSLVINKNQASNKVGLNHEIAETDLLKILDEKDISRVYLGGEFENSYLTKKEFELIGFLASGLTSYETGIKLKISNDTVNKHIKNIKNKLNCKTLCELGFAMGKIGSRNTYPFKKLGL
jgi:DNA-binding CsgD family transcriptional regulator